MTTTTLAEAMDRIATRAAETSLSAHHYKNTGRDLAALNCIDLRICCWFDDLVKGDRTSLALSDSALLADLELCLNTPGPLLFRAIKQASGRAVEAMRMIDDLS